ncbi:MAG: FliM/FliN family flagellar motor switch protein [Alphaproteobacteria bacterium]|nr:FliM/FliN family flagellar motor switch protein [Alphaproteobacteria bacterium]
MADEFNNAASSGQQTNVSNPEIDTSQVDNNMPDSNMPDDLTRILNEANPQNITSENMMPENTMPENIAPPDIAPQNTQNTGTVHIPPDGVQGETLGDKFDIDTLLNQTAQAIAGDKTADILAEQNIYHSNIADDNGAEHNATVQKAEPTVVTVPGFDVESTAMASVPLQIIAEIGTTELRIEQLMKIGRGAIIEIDKDIESELELKIGHHLIGQGHLESDGEYFQIRVVNMIADIDEHHTLFYASSE